MLLVVVLCTDPIGVAQEIDICGTVFQGSLVAKQKKSEGFGEGMVILVCKAESVSRVSSKMV